MAGKGPSEFERDEHEHGLDTTTREHQESGDASRMGRRRFLGSLGCATAGAAVCGFGALPGLTDEALAEELGPQSSVRANDAYEIRRMGAFFEMAHETVEQPVNRDDTRLPGWVGTFSKTLPHNVLGHVEPEAMRSLQRALKSGRQEDFDAIPLGHGEVRLVNPQAAFSFEFEGADPHRPTTPPAPSFTSIDAAAEAAEFYWMSQVRDIPYERYATDPTIAQAIDDLRRFPLFADVSAGTIFRGAHPGVSTGPYVSQFLLKAIPFGATAIPQRYASPLPNVDYMTSYEEWLGIQRGASPARLLDYEPGDRHLSTGRRLGEYVHRDFNYQSTMGAARILLGWGSQALDPANPYRSSATQDGFVTLGEADIMELVARASIAGLKAAWCQKWLAHRRLRPEVFGGRIHTTMNGHSVQPIHPTLLESPVLEQVHARHGTYLLPQAYPEGSPAHPAYPAGHGCFSGAGVTVLKAFFDEDFVIPDPVVPSDDGTELVPYDGPELTVGGELNKLAANIARARDNAGVHWRSDGHEGNLLGETMAIRLLEERRRLYSETFEPLQLRTFSGESISIG